MVQPNETFALVKINFFPWKKSNKFGEIRRFSRICSYANMAGAACRYLFKYRAYFRRCRCIWLNGSVEISSANISAISISDTHDLFMKKAPRATGGRRGGWTTGGRRRAGNAQQCVTIRCVRKGKR